MRPKNERTDKFLEELTELTKNTALKSAVVAVVIVRG